MPYGAGGSMTREMDQRVYPGVSCLLAAVKSFLAKIIAFEVSLKYRQEPNPY
jgi:hypothetical protein